MPIRSENRDKYPPDWPTISARIRRREGHRCKWCGVPNGALGCRDAAGRWCEAEPKGERLGALDWPRPGEEAWCRRPADGARVWGRIVRIVLTVAHLDHGLADHSDANLAALCQRCHLRHDARQHRQNAAATLRARKALGDLFAGAL